MRRAVLVLFITFPCFGISQPVNDTVRIIGVGDIMLGTSFPDGYLPPNDGRHLLTPVERYLQAADITFGNYEGTLFNGEGEMKKCKDSTKCYAFKTPEHYAAYLKGAGFDLMSVANNHSGDFGPEAREQTMKTLQKAGIFSSGTTTQPFVILKRAGITYGLASFAPNRGTQNINNHKSARRIVSYLDSLCDIVIVSFHGGGEGATRQHIPFENEIFLDEDRGDVYRFSRVVIDAGADVVFGHGPHVTRAVDLYKGRFIIYSLGNFATYGRFNLDGPAGIAPIMKVYVNRKGEFIKGLIIPIKQEGEGGPVPDDSGAVIKKIQSLTAKDFPESRLLIKNDGTVLKRKTTLSPKQKKAWIKPTLP
ncbi:MAG TPA: CapA family protein [Flavisolibacter sp.]|jgi:poly-gamma-glutamate capsule biosynthesis protein CapA/YwtB (metallophosphatase superfamily)|nr:CapA family protein [Flavisolibacter sp.]